MHVYENVVLELLTNWENINLLFRYLIPPDMAVGVGSCFNLHVNNRHMCIDKLQGTRVVGCLV